MTHAQKCWGLFLSIMLTIAACFAIPMFWNDASGRMLAITIVVYIALCFTNDYYRFKSKE